MRAAGRAAGARAHALSPARLLNSPSSSRQRSERKPQLRADDRRLVCLYGEGEMQHVCRIRTAALMAATVGSEKCVSQITFATLFSIKHSFAYIDLLKEGNVTIMCEIIHFRRMLYILAFWCAFFGLPALVNFLLPNSGTEIALDSACD